MLAVQLMADQSAISGTAITYSAGYTYITFSTTITGFANTNNLIWAFCDDDHTVELAFHGDNHQ